MRAINFYFQIHQPFRLRTYRFFDIGTNHHYYDDYLNRTILKKVADKCYNPMNNLLLDLIKEHGDAFRVTFSISGIALEQLEIYAPSVIASFKEMAQTGNVEFLAETYSHSLVSLRDEKYFRSQVELHSARIVDLFGIKPTAFRNTELIYSDEIGARVSRMGYPVMLTEGAKHILGWRSPNFMYHSAAVPELKLLLRNFQLSDDIGFRFSNRNWSEWPVTVDKYVGWLKNIHESHKVVNIFLDYETFGEHQWAETGIFDFMRELPGKILSETDFKFKTPTELAEIFEPEAAISVPYPISWADEERDLTAWLGNEMQDEAFAALYRLADKVSLTQNRDIKKDFRYLQTSDHFYYMCTKWFSDGAVHHYFNPYASPYEAFINYMNVISDFEIRVNSSMDEEKQDNLYGVPDPMAGVAPKTEPAADAGAEKKTEGFEKLLSLSKKEFDNVLEKLDMKDLVYSLYDKTEEEVERMRKKLPEQYRESFNNFFEEVRSLKIPTRETIEGYRRQLDETLKKFFS